MTSAWPTMGPLVAQDGPDPAERAEVVVVADGDHVGGLLDRLLDRPLDDVVATLQGALRRRLLLRVEHAAVAVPEARRGEAGAEQQRLDACLVERGEHRSQPGRPARGPAHALGEAVERLAL